MLSIIIPFHNEAENLALLLGELQSSLGTTDFELIFVNDGSTDESAKILSAAIKRRHLDSKTKLIEFHQRQGKGRALSSGFASSTGETIIFMDADLQDDPEDLKLFIDKINEGAHVVNGWRKTRLDKSDKTLPSTIANKLLWRGLMGSTLHDMNCGFKAFRRVVLKDIVLYGDNYRFLPYLAEQRGYKSAEVVVSHRPRLHGRSKYTAIRLLLGLIDSLSTYVIVRFSEKPLHFFGGIGAAIFISGLAIFSVLSYEWLFFGEVLSTRPLFLVSIFFMIVGIQIVMTGILAEIVVYLNSKNYVNKQ